MVGPGKTGRIRIGFDKLTNRPKGFAHIDFVDAESAKKALQELNGALVKGREIRVDQARRRDELPSREQRPFAPRTSSGQGSRGSFTQGNTVFIGNLAWDMTGELIEEMINDVLGPDLFHRVSVCCTHEIFHITLI